MNCYAGEGMSAVCTARTAGTGGKLGGGDVLGWDGDALGLALEGGTSGLRS